MLGRYFGALYDAEPLESKAVSALQMIVAIWSMAPS